MRKYYKGMKNTILFLGLFVAPFLVGAQFLPEKLGSAVNSVYDEINPVTSPGGDTLYFTRVGHPENTYGKGKSQDIWFTIKDNMGRWSDAQRLSDRVNIGRFNALFSISPDGKKAMINGIYNRKGNFWKKRGLSVITMSEDGWGKPEKLKIAGLQKMLDGRYFSAYMDWEQEVIVMSFNGSFNSKKANLFISVKKGKHYKKPIRLNKLNNSGNEFSPFISADGTTLFYASNKKRSQGYNIMKAVRKDNRWKKWSAPEALSDTINSKANESYFKTSPDGSSAFYSSDSSQAGNKDIFYVKLFEPNPFIIVSGHVKYKDSDISVAGREIDIHVNDQPADSVVIDQETGSYKVVLPLGEDYQLKAVIPDSDYESMVVAASSLQEMTTMSIDLYVSPWQHAKVTGRLFERTTGVALPADLTPIIMINGRVSDQLKIEEGTGNFETTFALGSTYTIKAVVDGYLSPETKIDLTGVTEYVELEENIQVEKIKEAVVSGKLINKKTFEALADTVKVNILINDEPGVVTVDTVRQTYSLTLPLGNIYTLSAKAENFYPQSEVLDLSNENEDIKIYRDLYLNPLEIGEAVSLENITFEPAKAVLKPTSYAELNEVVNFLQDNAKIKIQVAGYTDSAGSEVTNQKLSDLRAKAVKDYIVAQEIEPSRVTHIGYGEANPIADNTTEEGRQLNRRVEFVVVENQ